MNFKEFIIKYTFFILFIIYIFLYFNFSHFNREYFSKYKLLIVVVQILFFLVINSNYSFYLNKNSIESNIQFKNSYTFFIIIFMFYLYPETILTSGDTDFAKLFPIIIENRDWHNICSYIHNYELSDFQRDDLFVYENFNTKQKVILPYNYIYNGTGCYPSYSFIPGIFNYLIYNFLSLFGYSLSTISNLEKVSYINTFFILYLEKFSASLLATFTSYMLFQYLKKYFIKFSVFLVVVYSFSTNHFSNSSQTLWQHGFVEFIITYFLVSFSYKNKSNLIYFSDGILISIAILMRSVSIFPILGVIFLFLYKNLKLYFSLKLSNESENYKISQFFLRVPNINKQSKFLKIVFNIFNIYTFIGFLIGLSFFIYINLDIYGNLLGGYGTLHIELQNKGIIIFDLNRLRYNILNVLVSPGYGLLIYNPVLIWIFYNSVKYYSKYSISLFGVFLFYIFIISSYYSWNGGFSYGSRLFTDLSVFSILSLGYIINKIDKISKSILLLSFISFLIQFTGVSSNIPFSWNSCYKVDLKEKLWNWENTPFLLPYKKYYSNRIDLETQCSLGTIQRADDYFLIYFPENIHKEDVPLLDFEVFVLKRKKLYIEYETKEKNQLELKIKSLYLNKKEFIDIEPFSNKIIIDLSGNYGSSKVKIKIKNNLELIIKRIELLEK